MLSYYEGRPRHSSSSSHWLPTATARVQSRVWSSGICGGQSGAGAGFLRVLRFPLLMFIPPNSPASQSLGACIIGRKWLTYRVDPVWTPPLNMRIKNYYEGIPA
jgi:hypothetical protein